jgi:hypothetical protein
MLAVLTHPHAEAAVVVSRGAERLAHGLGVPRCDVAVLAGYPGTIASTWQQAGRAGRRQTTALVVLVAGSDPVDQYLITHPESFFESSPEFGRIDPDNLRIGMRFHDDDQDHTALTLTHDGGGGGHKRRERNNLSVMTAALMTRNPWVMAVAKDSDKGLRRFAPEWIGIDKLWVIELRPTFERHASAIDDVPSDAQGIYRYVHRGEIVYIGKGNIRERLRRPERDGWQWEQIEYSVIDAEPQQFKWESWWLDWFERSNGSLPRYNRIGGRDA